MPAKEPDLAVPADLERPPRLEATVQAAVELTPQVLVALEASEVPVRSSVLAAPALQLANSAVDLPVAPVVLHSLGPPAALELALLELAALEPAAFGYRLDHSARPLVSDNLDYRQARNGSLGSLAWASGSCAQAPARPS